MRFASQEIRGAQTGVGADADPNKRHVVRLTSVQQTEDPDWWPLYRRCCREFRSGADHRKLPGMCACAALALCLSTASAAVAVARGNIVITIMATQGMRRIWGMLAAQLVMPTVGERCEPAAVKTVPPRFSAPVSRAPVDTRGPLSGSTAHAVGCWRCTLVADLDGGTIPSYASGGSALVLPVQYRHCC
ncbi:MAG: hypothetical protein R2867_26240 [Caldilineaceae bacterium]